MCRSDSMQEKIAEVQRTYMPCRRATVAPEALSTNSNHISKNPVLSWQAQILIKVKL
jgi:hypothetical protein